MLSFALVGLATDTAPLQAETMKSAVQAALTTNPENQAGKEDVRASALELLQLEEDYLPRVTLFGEASAQIFDDPSRLAASDNRNWRFGREIGLAAELTLFDGYRRANRVYRNAARVDEAVFGLLDGSETLALNAVEAYIDVIRHNQLLGIAEQNIRRHRVISRQVKQLVDAGRLSSSDDFEMQERLLGARLGKLRVAQALANTRVRYNAVVGHMPGGNMQIPSVHNLPATLQELTIRSIRENYRVRLADTRISQSRYQVDIGMSDTLPQVKLRAGVRHGTDLDGLSGDESDAFLGLRFDWDLYSGGRKARRSALNHRTAEAVAERAVAVREVQELAARTWISYETNIERTVLLGMQARAAQNAADQYQKQFSGGTRSLLDVLDAESNLFNVRFEEISARASLAFGQFRLLAVQSRLAAYFGAKAAGVPLIPSYEKRARTGRPTAIFNTEIRSLE